MRPRDNETALKRYLGQAAYLKQLQAQKENCSNLLLGAINANATILAWKMRNSLAAIKAAIHREKS